MSSPAVATHLVMSFAQTLMHYLFGHRPMGGKFFRNHMKARSLPELSRMADILKLATNRPQRS